MYTKYWNLDCRPFENTTHPRCLFASETHQATLMKLRYAVENRRGSALVAGGSGLGKTLLVNVLAEQLDDDYDRLVHLKFPQMPPDQLLNYLAGEITGTKTEHPASIENSVHRIQRALADNEQNDLHTVVVIDEAHLLRDTGALETIRLLLNFEAAWTLILSGQTPLLTALERMPELDERLGVKCLLRRFTVEETAAYVDHRLQLAGGSGTIFEPAAIEAIHRLADGVPRRINRLGDLCLLIGFAEEYSVIQPQQVEAVANEFVGGSSALRQAA